MISGPLSQYEEILKDAIRTSMKESGAKLAITFQNLIIEILTLYMILHKVYLFLIISDFYFKRYKYFSMRKSSK